MLSVLGVRRVIGLVEEPAARRFEIVRKRPALRHDILAYSARLPQILVRVGVFVKPVGEYLIEVTAGDDIVALFVFRLNKLTQLLCLRDLALAVVISLQVEIYDDKLAARSGYRQIAHEQAALEICGADRPIERTGQRYALGRVDIVHRCRQKSAVYPADRRHGVGDEFARVVERIGAVVYAKRVSFVLPVGSGGVFIDLLQHEYRCRIR